MNMDQLKINRIEKQRLFEDEMVYWVIFTVGGINEYKACIVKDKNNIFKVRHGVVGLANGERARKTIKCLERELESYSLSDDEKGKKRVREINAIFDEWDQVVENIEDIEKLLNDLIIQDPKYRLKVLF